MKEQSPSYKPPESILHKIPEKWRIGAASALVVVGTVAAYRLLQENPSPNVVITTNHQGSLPGQHK